MQRTNAVVATAGRIVFWVGLLVIVGRYVLERLAAGDVLMAVLGFVFFPLTYFISPWFFGLWWLLSISLAGYWISTAHGLGPVD